MEKLLNALLKGFVFIGLFGGFMAFTLVVFAIIESSAENRRAKKEKQGGEKDDRN